MYFKTRQKNPVDFFPVDSIGKRILFNSIFVPVDSTGLYSFLLKFLFPVGSKKIRLFEKNRNYENSQTPFFFSKHSLNSIFLQMEPASGACSFILKIQIIHVQLIGTLN